ncbi:hypothetical protein BPTFM16_01977 [Altererythrobacter insulae]|nr:hypothetical protein BPTFM16_01977 [Altererythrobacter insulae]
MQRSGWKPIPNLHGPRNTKFGGAGKPLLSLLDPPHLVPPANEQTIEGPEPAAPAPFFAKI